MEAASQCNKPEDYSHNLIQTLSMLMRPTLVDEERLVHVKVLNGLLIEQLDNRSVGPYTRQILVLIEPMLIDENHNTCVKGKEVISNLSKAVGLANMIAAIRQDVDCVDGDIRRMTAIAFSVVASALGIPAILPFLEDVCQSKRSCQTGVKIVEEIAVLMGSEIVPHLSSLIDIIQDGCKHEEEEVRISTDSSFFALAEAAAPSGVEIPDYCIYR